MNSAVRRILINDIGLGQTHKAVWKYLLEKNSHRGDKWEIIWSSELKLVPPPNWRVKPEIALTLASKLWPWQNPLPGGLTLYLQGNLICQGNFSELLTQKPLGCLETPQRGYFAYWNLFLINHGAKDHSLIARKFQQLAARGYGLLAEFEPTDISLLPPEWLPASFGERPQAPIIDCTPIGERPWYSAFAPSGELWCTQLRYAWKQGYLSWDDINRDGDRGLVRPSLLWQMKQGVDNPLHLPPTVLAADTTFIPPELALSPAQRQVIETTTFRLPGRELHRLLLSPEYLFRFELPHQLRQVGAIAKKILINLGLKL